MRLSFHIHVQQEVNDAVRWYEEQSDGLGDTFFEQLQATLALISEHPERCSFWLRSKTIRRAKMNRFPYDVLFEIRPDRVRVICLRHEKRHPNYGSGRS